MMRYLCFFHLKIERLIGSTLITQQIPLPKQLKIAFLAGAGCTQRQIVYRTETYLGTVNKYVKMINQEEEDDTKIDCKKQICKISFYSF